MKARDRTKITLLSASTTFSTISAYSSISSFRERRCYAVFNALIDLVPDLKRRLEEANGSEGVLEIAALVCSHMFSDIWSTYDIRYRRVSHAQGPTTLEVLKAQFLIGSFLMAKH